MVRDKNMVTADWYGKDMWPVKLCRCQLPYRVTFKAILAVSCLKWLYFTFPFCL